MSEQSMAHLNFLDQVAKEDVCHLMKKEATYRGSWKRRGGVGAFMMLARKWDRLEPMMECDNIRYDVFKAIALEPSGTDGSALAEIRDLRRYLLLVEAEMIAQGYVSVETSKPESAPVPASSSAMGRIARGTIEGTTYDSGPTGRLRAAEFSRSMVKHAEMRMLSDGEREPQEWSCVVVTLRDSPFPWYNVDRRCYSEEATEHLPRLFLEQNDKEWSELPEYYRGMYFWDESDLKHKLRDEFRERWGRHS